MIIIENENRNTKPELSHGSIKKIHGKSNSKRINVLYQAVAQLKRSLHRQRITKTFFLLNVVLKTLNNLILTFY